MEIYFCKNLIQQSLPRSIPLRPRPGARRFQWKSSSERIAALDQQLVSTVRLGSRSAGDAAPDFFDRPQSSLMSDPPHPPFEMLSCEVLSSL